MNREKSPPADSRIIHKLTTCLQNVLSIRRLNEGVDRETQSADSRVHYRARPQRTTEHSRGTGTDDATDGEVGGSSEAKSDSVSVHPKKSHGKRAGEVKRRVRACLFRRENAGRRAVPPRRAGKLSLPAESAPAEIFHLRTRCGITPPAS